MYAAGVAEITDVDQIRINLTQLKNTKKYMERNISLTYNMLRFQLGLNAGETIILSDSLTHLINTIEKELLSFQEYDIENNPNLKMIKTQEELMGKQVILEKWAYAPTLAGFYQYTEKFLTTSFDLSPKNVAGLTLSVPIFSGFDKRARVNKAKIEFDKATTTRQQIEEQLLIQKKQLEFEYKSAFENYITQKENIEIAQRVYDNINNKYRQGLVSSLDLTQANSNYLQAKNNYISSVMDLLQAKLELNKLYNQL
jgi:outer membrane protein TolC